MSECGVLLWSNCGCAYKLTELRGDLSLREKSIWVHRPFKVLLQDVLDGQCFLWLPDTAGQQHVA